eukprot:CAMPEP_0179202650 /NCGR_PEP_ID=MMETSP0796-20121207/100945_1 /TAXON_ID=73915 /ORGANISM="Pyrodinium bahamense, Strain pbaha01" /LENGTH=339 /DNA_ID=CAMNT_0020907379 /DNA_START=223 /DNA_END=1242 /DNA_ORIENTATION=+
MKLNKMPARTNWFFLAHALGNTVVGFLPRSGSETLWNANWKAASIPALMDIVSYVQLFAGVALAGAQTKSILYSSSILWSAVLSRVLLGKVLSKAQWGSITLLFLGLLLKSGAGGKVAAGAASTSFALGVGLILAGCFTHALVNVRNEALISKGHISSKILCVLVGIYALMIWCGLYACGLIIPEKKGDSWVFSSDHFSLSSLVAQDAAPGLPMNSGPAWFGFVFSSGVHAGCFFSLLGRVGTVSSGVVKGMTVSCYVLLSGLAFCGVDAGYCLNFWTLSSAAVCVSSVFCYSLATARAKAAAAGSDKKVDAPSSSQPERSSSGSLSPSGPLRLRSMGG